MPFIRTTYPITWSSDSSCKDCGNSQPTWSVTLCESFSDSVDADATEYISLCDACLNSRLAEHVKLIHHLELSVFQAIQDIRWERKQREVISSIADNEKLYDSLMK
jgi:hypothetical protein